MSITRLQQARQMMNEGGPMRKIKGQDHMLAYITPSEKDILVELGGQETMTPEGILAYPPLGQKGTSPGTTTSGASAYSGGDDRREQASVASTQGKSTPTPQEVRNIVNQGPEDRGSNLQNYRHNVANRPEANLPPQLQPPIELNKREQAFQNFVDYRKPVQTFGLSGLFKKPIQAFSDFNASINRPYFEKVIRAGKIPGLSFDMTQQQFEDAYQNYMSNRLAGKTDAYGNPVQGFEYGDDNILTGRFQDNGGGGIMDVVDDNTVNDDADGDGDVDQDDFIFRYFDKTGETLQAGAGGVQDLMKSIRKRISNIFS